MKHVRGIYNVGKWIDLNKERPAIGRDVITYDIFGCIRIASIADPLYGNNFWFYPESTGSNQDQITHWQPLPNPPEEDDGA